MELVLPDLAATEALGAAIARLLLPGDAVLLSGNLGAGKTALARALLRAALADPALDVPSPSYTLVQTYLAKNPNGTTLALHHIDLWRLEPDAEASVLELGWDEMRDGVVVVEWPDRLGGLAPFDALAVSLRIDGEACRRAVLEGWAGRAGKLQAVLF